METCMVKGASPYAVVHPPALQEEKSTNYYYVERIQHARHTKEYPGPCALSFSP